MNPIRFALAQCLSVALMMNSGMCRATEDHAPLLGGAMLTFSSPLTAKEQKTFGSGWKVATYMSAEGDTFNLFPLEAFTPTGGVIFGDAIPTRISPTGKYAVIDMLRAGVVDPGPSGRPEIQTRQYCPVLETKTGCVVSSQSGEVCGGEWEKQSDRWMVAGLADDASVEMLKHQFGDANTLWDEYAISADKPFRVSIQEAVSSSLGIYNLMACDSLNVKNVAAYKSIAMELRKAGDKIGSGYIVKKLQDFDTQAGHVESRKITVQRAFLFDKPGVENKTRMYLVRDDDVRVLSEEGEWVKIEYTERNGHSIQKWIRSEFIN